MLLRRLSAARPHLLCGQGQPGRRDRRDARPQGRQFRRREPRRRSRCASPTASTARPALLRQHDKEGKGHRLRLSRPGVRLFAFDSEAELDKLAAPAPGARVFCRILVSCEGADWPLVAQIRLRAGDGGRRCCARPASSASTPTASRSMSARSRPTSAQWDGAIGAAAQMFSPARRSRHQSAHGQYRRRLSGALPRRGAGRRALCPGGDGGD